MIGGIRRHENLPPENAFAEMPAARENAGK
jgi:hypothetical protein